MIKKALFATAVALAGFVGTAQAATVVFSDNFDGYGNATVLNVGVSPNVNFLQPNWTSTPSVDYLAQGSGYAELCRSTGNCIDLDGSTSSSGLLSTVMSFAAGTYQVAYELFGNGRGAPATNVTITLGDKTLNLTSIASGDDASGTWTITTTAGGVLSFLNSSGNNQGAVLSSVTVSAVPLPAGGLLLLGALGGIAALRRRKTL